jgi:hypothetical protein
MPIALAGALVLAGCGDDAGASEEYADFCDAELAMEQASSGEDEAAIGAAADQLIEASPNDDTRDKVQATLDAFAALQGAPDADFNETYGELMAVVEDNCGFQEMDVTAENYSFSGIDDEYEAGGTLVTFENEADEFHEMLLMRRVDGDDTPIMDLLMMDDDEVGAHVTEAGGAFAGPGQTSYGAFDLEPGNYVVVCFVSKGTTQAVFDEMMAGGPEPDGEPHAMLGMTAEFEVAS